MRHSSRGPHWMPLLVAKNRTQSLQRLTKVRQQFGEMLAGPMGFQLKHLHGWIGIHKQHERMIYPAKQLSIFHSFGDSIFSLHTFVTKLSVIKRSQLIHIYMSIHVHPFMNTVCPSPAGVASRIIFNATKAKVYQESSGYLNVVNVDCLNSLYSYSHYLVY